MLPAHKLKLIEELVTGANKEELIWISGYISGILQNNAVTASPEQPKASVNKITIAYGTESGNSKKLATDFASRAKKQGIAAKVVSLDQYRLNDLPKEEYFFTVVSTQGEGDPPASAKKFYDHIHNNGFRLEKLKYGVLALGDTSYPLFCKAGEDVDNQLNKLGGKRIVPLQKCDTDYESDADQWFNEVLNNLTKTSSELVKISAPTQQKAPKGKRIYNGTLLTKVNLNDKGSNKETYHIEIGCEDVEYLPGDSLGIIPNNPAAMVGSVIELAGIDPHKKMNYKDQELKVTDILTNKLHINYLPERVVAKYAELTGHDIPVTKIGLVDLLKIYPLKNGGQFEQLIEILEPIAPRLYSISSSPEAHGGEVHITVAKDSFHINEALKHGLCSNYLSLLPVDSEIEFYIHKNTQFRLPEGDKDVIMIGPGTGVAPFRSFLWQREASGSEGRNWLFFGDQHFVTDFLYQSEIQNWLDTGILTKVNVAFSRDQKEKVYVQHKMLHQGKELYSWLQGGAYIYVCGAKEPMSVDVENTLLKIIEEYGGKSQSEAIEFLELLKEEGRYLKDVY